MPACPPGEQRDNNDIMSLQRRQSPLEVCHGTGLRALQDAGDDEKAPEPAKAQSLGFCHLLASIECTPLDGMVSICCQRI